MKGRAALVMARAISATLASPAFRGTLNDDDRAWIILSDLCAALYPLSPVHVPSRQEIERLADQLVRDHEICRDFDGRNYDELAQRHRLTVRQVRRIVERDRKRKRAPAPEVVTPP